MADVNQNIGSFSSSPERCIDFYLLAIYLFHCILYLQAHHTNYLLIKNCLKALFNINVRKLTATRNQIMAIKRRVVFVGS